MPYNSQRPGFIDLSVFGAPQLAPERAPQINIEKQVVWLLATRILHVSLAVKRDPSFGLVKINSGCTQPDYTLAPESPPQINIEKQVVWLLATRILHVSLA
ncbi:MAG: hypothetical protein WC785_05925, partial [Tatlockia sp.]